MLAMLGTTAPNGADGMRSMIFSIVIFICVYVFLYDPSAAEGGKAEECDACGACSRGHRAYDKRILRDCH